MKKIFLILSALYIALPTLAPASASARSFHGGGAASCSGCHSMHGSEDGFSISASSAPLLRASDPGSICLNCHSGAGGPTSPSVFSFDGSALTPGGDFYWVTKTFTWADGSSPAALHGHNVVAADYNLHADPNRIQSPGGTFPAARLSCLSCHDPHAWGRDASLGGPITGSGSYGAVAGSGTRVGSYRLLGGRGYTVEGFTFTADVPVARQSALKPFAETDASHVDYGSGMSEWCGNCHAGMLNGHQSASGSFMHPAGNLEKFGATTIDAYNSYVRTGDLTGTAATAYLQFVPFERGTSDVNLLDPNSTHGPDFNSNLMCLTCHRAHASAFPYAGRWDFNAALLVDSHPAIGDSGATAADVSNSYYGRDILVEFGPDQEPFCAKCHPGGAPAQP